TKMTDPSESKKEGKKLKLRSDWESVKVQVMFDVCKSKFEDPELREALLETGTRHLEEGNTHGDTCWGTVNGKGSNHLGKVLMKVREEIKQSSKRTND
ncbi:NADAR family protein, partial [Mangrovimonas sp. AS39]|uniref:NADAR family protein n=1 Tax=Mangrovimonas futianensis TaxID=2895523 RepID=UPI001E2C00BE